MMTFFLLLATMFAADPLMPAMAMIYLTDMAEVCSTLDSIEKNEYITDIICTADTDPNPLFQKITKGVEYLVVFSMRTDDQSMATFDFSRLPNQMIVMLYAFGYYGKKYNVSQVNNKVIKAMGNVGFDGTQRKIIEFTTLWNKKEEYRKKKYNSLAPKYSSSILKINGAIKSKVSFLIIALSMPTKFTSTLDCDSVYIVTSSFTSDSALIRTSNLIVFDSYILYSILNDNNLPSDFIQVNQLGIIFGLINEYVRVSYQQNNWKIMLSSTKYFSNPSNYVYIPYTNCKILNILSFSLYYSLFLENSNVDEIRKINITYSSFTAEPPISNTLEENTLKIVTESSTPNLWESVAKPVVVIAHDSSIKIDAKDAIVEIKEEGLYSYKPKGLKKTNVGAIVGGVIGGLAAVAIIAVAIVFYLRYKKKKENDDEQNSIEN